MWKLSLCAQSTRCLDVQPTHIPTFIDEMIGYTSPHLNKHNSRGLVCKVLKSEEKKCIPLMLPISDWTNKMLIEYLLAEHSQVPTLRSIVKVTQQSAHGNAKVCCEFEHNNRTRMFWIPTPVVAHIKEYAAQMRVTLKKTS